MTEFDPINENDPARPQCAAGQAALQRLLDGEADWDSPEAAAHRAGCIACREELALAGSIDLRTNVVMPAALTDQVLKTVVAAHRRRRAMRFAGAGFALAASVVIAVIALRPSQDVKDMPGPVAIVPAPHVEPKTDVVARPLGESVTEAADAIVSLTRRTASETRDQSALLLPNPKMPETPDTPDGLEPLADARTGAARSVEPIRDSAMRAINFFARAAEPSQRRN